VLIYDFAAETLVQTMLDLGADYVSTHDAYGAYIRPHSQDNWINAQVVRVVNELAATGPPLYTRKDRFVFDLSPLRFGRLMITVLPGGYVVAVLGGLQNWLSNALARKLADVIENWLGERQNPYWVRPARVSRYPGL
jgi:hypothetical protein